MSIISEKETFCKVHSMFYTGRGGKMCQYLFIDVYVLYTCSIVVNLRIYFRNMFASRLMCHINFWMGTLINIRLSTFCPAKIDASDKTCRRIARLGSQRCQIEVWRYMTREWEDVRRNVDSVEFVQNDSDRIKTPLNGGIGKFHEILHYITLQNPIIAIFLPFAIKKIRFIHHKTTSLSIPNDLYWISSFSNPTR